MCRAAALHVSNTPGNKKEHPKENVKQSVNRIAGFC
jgi:hypothetical protein